MTTKTPTSIASAETDRRAFLGACGKFAAVTPPAMTLLLSTSLTSSAIAYSGGKGHHDYSGHHEDYGHKEIGHHYGQLKNGDRDD